MRIDRKDKKIDLLISRKHGKVTVMEALYAGTDRYKDTIRRGVTLGGAVDVFSRSVRKARRQLMQDERVRKEVEMLQASNNAHAALRELGQEVAAIQRQMGEHYRRLPRTK